MPSPPCPKSCEYRDGRPTPPHRRTVQKSSSSISPLFNNIPKPYLTITPTPSYPRIVTAQSRSPLLPPAPHHPCVHARTSSRHLTQPLANQEIEYDGTNRIFPPVTPTKQTTAPSKQEPGEPDSNRISATPENHPQPPTNQAPYPYSHRTPPSTSNRIQPSTPPKTKNQGGRTRAGRPQLQQTKPLPPPSTNPANPTRTRNPSTPTPTKQSRSPQTPQSAPKKRTRAPRSRPHRIVIYWGQPRQYREV